MSEFIPEKRKRNRGIRVGRLAKRMTHFLSYEIDQSDPKEFVQYCLKWCVDLMERQGISTADEQIKYLIAFQKESGYFDCDNNYYYSDEVVSFETAYKMAVAKKAATKKPAAKAVVKKAAPKAKPAAKAAAKPAAKKAVKKPAAKKPAAKKK